MTALAAWLAMGGYAAFVWPAYGVAVIVLGGITVHAWRRHRRSDDSLARQQQRLGRGE